MSADETVTIPAARYKRLVDRSEFLAILEAAGVDNWDGYPGYPDDEDGEV